MTLVETRIANANAENRTAIAPPENDQEAVRNTV
jgi:hypothetical protein